MSSRPLPIDAYGFNWFDSLTLVTVRPGRNSAAADWTSTDLRSDFAKHITTLVMAWTDDKILLLINLYEKHELTH